MQASYPRALDFTLKYEGEWSDHPSDPGGATMKGVTKARYEQFLGRSVTKTQLRYIPDEHLQAIYKKGYWDAINADALPAGVDACAFDLAVNSGVGRAKQFLPITKDERSIEWVKRMCARRMSFLRNLKTFRVFGKGWTRRVVALEAMCIRMASGSAAPVRLKEEAAKAKSKVKAHSGGVAVAATSGAGSQQLEVAATLPTWATVSLSVCLCLIVAGFVWKAWQHHERAKAMEAA